MDSAQTWAIIGAFTTIMLGGMTLMTTLLTRATTSAIVGLEGRLGGRIDALEAQMNGRFDAVNARFDAVNTRIDHLDRDVTTLMRRAWGEHTGE